MISVSSLPALNAILNTISALLLLCGYVLVKSGARKAHQYCMTAALLVSASFLISYLIYHYHIGSRPYEGEGLIRYLYFTILITHSILAAVLVPLVPVTVIRAWRKNFAGHKSIARKTFPIWVYVSITGVLIYLMLYGF
jgi:uncharacterized membrane protein YozB (DUF420 family)